VRFWADGKQRERSFRTRKEADDFKIKTDHDVRAQIFVDDRAGRQKFSDAATAWLNRKAIAEGTKRVALEYSIACHLHCCRHDGRSDGWLAGCCSRSSTC
jgi:hypothetical protein